ncbi:MAG: hypothetical protein ACT6S0_04815 [Roseateles sp.]|uniref:hypothetical protein n=1 Tax=Roseateles sp. TaxID=1971397 RepID=UPI004035D1C5
MSEGMKAVYATLGLIAAAVIGYIWGGYVFSILWAWFIVTAFALPALSVAQAIGLTLAGRFLLARWKPVKEEDSSPGAAMASSFVVPLLFLAIGWVVKQWLPA